MVVRPPPLQLRDDNTRYGRRLVKSRPSSDSPSVFSRLYDSSWRTLVIIVATINAIRYLCSVLVMSELWKELDIDEASLRSRKLRGIILALGTMYFFTGMIEIFGGVSAITRRLKSIRLYTHLTAISAILVTSAGILVAVTHFTFADEIIKHCMSQAKTNNDGIKLIFRSTISAETQSAIESECLDKWSVQSSTQILGVFLFYLFPSTIYTIVVYTYYRQCIDPLHAASLYSQTLTLGGRHPYARLPNDPPTAYSARLLQHLSATVPVFGHYRNGMCARHRPDGSLIISKNSKDKGEKYQSEGNLKNTHVHCQHHHRPSGSSRSASPQRSDQGSASSASASKRWTSNRRAMSRIQLQRTRSDRSDTSLVTVSPGPPSYSGVVYDTTYNLADYDIPPEKLSHSADAEGKFIN
ncbi:hypothetical protein K435DRAFT_970546 [Dendrothele bispora CBS 962.96]|uniref:Uncharacterized protein n=1 Tax=Dendrothele bispora (strain CBS 962.96) TaxID=1314807 RepID=A0A4S8LAK6_DENBC|nr:hypothetical protein K435DRAFT_970546 [Dendrothele bispora CBS 962.96]